MTIICDLQEKRSKIPTKLRKKGAKIKLQKLPVGDYWYEWLCIERKPHYQFIADMFSRQLDKQIANMLKFCAQKNMTPCLMVEADGKVETKQQLIIEKHCRTLGKDIWIVHTYGKSGSDNATLETILYYAKKLQKGKLIQGFRRPSVVRGSKKDAIAVLTGFTGIDEERAKAILVEYGNLLKAFHYIERWSEEVEGIGPTIQKRVLGRFAEPYRDR